MSKKKIKLMGYLGKIKNSKGKWTIKNKYKTVQEAINDGCLKVTPQYLRIK